MWLGARPYDVATRQFLAPDPLAPLPGMPGSTSPYTYAANDPINLFDPTGRQPISIEAWNDVRDRRTGPQWQNIASVAIAVVAVAVTVVTLGTAGPVVMVLGGAAIGALAGGASGLAREAIESDMHLGDGEFNGETIIKDVIVGAAGGALGGGVGVGFNALAEHHPHRRYARCNRSSASRGGSAFAEGGLRLRRRGPGRDLRRRRCRRTGVPTARGTTTRSSRTLSSAASPAVPSTVSGVRARHGGSDVPTTASADPSTIGLPASPTPNAPDPVPVSTATSTGGLTAPDPTSQISGAGATGDAPATTAGGTSTAATTSAATTATSPSDTSRTPAWTPPTDTSDTTAQTTADTQADPSDTASDTSDAQTETSDTASDTSDAQPETVGHGE